MFLGHQTNENSAYTITGINYILKYIKIENSSFKLFLQNIMIAFSCLVKAFP